MTHRIAIGIVVLSAAACGKHPVTPTSPSSAPLSVRQESSSYVFRYSPGDRIDVAWQEVYNAWAIAALEVAPSRRVTYNKYLSRTHMGDLTGNYSTNGYAESSSFTIHTLWPTDNHEVVHVYSALFGSPPPLFNEGLAVAHQTDPVRGDLTPRWNGVGLHEWARRFRRAGTLIPLANLLEAAGFRRFDPELTYPQSGSFVTYLLDSYGLERLKTFFRGGSPTEAAGSVRQRFLSVYGRSIDDVERDWLALLDGL